MILSDFNNLLYSTTSTEIPPFVVHSYSNRIIKQTHWVERKHFKYKNVSQHKNY